MARNRDDLSKLIEPFRVVDGARFRLADHDCGATEGLDELKQEAQERLARGIELLSDLQERLYAQDRWALLVVFQAMDAAGKDSAIKHVFTGLNPQGVQVESFKAPSEEELDHDYLWRCATRLPERGRIGIFNRSYYEEVIVVRVHPEILAREKLPQRVVGPDLWQQRLEDIRGFERYLSRNGVAVVKFFLNVSREEQRKRFLARLDEPDKNWKFSAADVAERARWDDYMRAYEDAIRATATPEAPWYVVPADKKWFTRLVVAEAIADALEALELEFPKASREQRAGLEAARSALEGEGR